MFCSCLFDVLPQSKDTHVRVIADSKFAEGVNGADVNG